MLYLEMIQELRYVEPALGFVLAHSLLVCDFLGDLHQLPAALAVHPHAEIGILLPRRRLDSSSDLRWHFFRAGCTLACTGIERSRKAGASCLKSKLSLAQTSKSFMEQSRANWTHRSLDPCDTLKSQLKSLR